MLLHPLSSQKILLPLQIDTVGAGYQVAAGHLDEESDTLDTSGRLLALMECAKSMLEVRLCVTCAHVPDTC